MQIDIGNTKGVIRKITGDGRITIPASFKKALNMQVNEEVEIFFVNDGIFIRKVGNKSGK